MRSDLVVSPLGMDNEVEVGLGFVRPKTEGRGESFAWRPLGMAFRRDSPRDRNLCALLRLVLFSIAQWTDAY